MKENAKKKKDANKISYDERLGISGTGRGMPIDLFSAEDMTDSDSKDDTCCCGCGQHQPDDYKKNTYIKFLNWGKCDLCDHWTHLKYCSTVKAIRRDTVFCCPALIKIY